MFLLKTDSTLLRSKNDEELIRAYQQEGDPRYFSEFFDRYAPFVFDICRRFLKDEEESRDIVMRTFEKCLRNPAGLPPRSIARWLFILSRNECIEVMRRRSQQRSTTACYHGPANEASLTSDHEPHTTPDPGALLPIAMRQLRREQRICLELFFFQEKSYREVASDTGLSIRQVKSHLQNGKRRLRAILERLRRETS